MEYTGALFSGVMFGIIATVLTTQLNVVMFQIRWRMEGGFGKRPETVAEMRARLSAQLLEQPVYLLPWTISALAGLVLLILQSLLGGSAASLFSTGFAFLMTITIGAVIAYKSYGKTWELNGKRYAAEIIFRYLPIEHQVDRLLQTALSQRADLRRHAIESFRGFVSDEMFISLIRSEKEPYSAIYLLARSLDAALQPLLDQIQPISVEGIRLLASLPFRNKVTLVNALNTRGASVGLQKASKILFAQYHHLKAFPDVYCMACKAWTDKIAFKDAAWLQCKVCQDALHLISPVRRVVGQIGGSGDSHSKDGTLTLNLWNPNTMQPVVATIDTLEIIGGQDMDYNWAVNSVLGQLHNAHASDNRPMRVQLTGDPPLDLNTRRLLKLDSSS